MRAIDLSGKKFGKLTAIRMLDCKRGNLLLWECICDCGNIKIAPVKTLRNGGTKSCGCLLSELCIKNLPDNKRPVGYKKITNKGYVSIKTTDGFVREHIHVMENHIGRKIRHGECVHHIDENKLNNDISNLRIMSHGDHTREHHAGSKRTDQARKNISDGIKKSIQKNGRKGRKLTKDDVIAIRERHSNGSKKFTETSRIYGVTPPLIRSIVNRKTWSYI